MIKQILNLKNWLPRVVALSVAVVVYVVLTNFSSVWDGIRTFCGYFSPVFLGCVIAYLVNPLAKLLARSVFIKMKKERKRQFFSNGLAFVVVLAVIALLMAILIPQLVESVSSFTANLDSYLESLRTAFPGLNKSFGSFLNKPDVLASREKLLSAAAAAIRNNADSLLEFSALAGKSLIQWLIGLFLSVYLLAEKDSLKSGVNDCFWPSCRRQGISVNPKKRESVVPAVRTAEAVPATVVAPRARVNKLRRLKKAHLKKPEMCFLLFRFFQNAFLWLLSFF